MWTPAKKEIEEWLETKEQGLARKDNRNPQISSEQWLQRYVFTNEHEIFFAKFHIILVDWLLKLAELNQCIKEDEPKI